VADAVARHGGIPELIMTKNLSKWVIKRGVEKKRSDGLLGEDSIDYEVWM
jgi:hypothetical protein